MNLRTMSTSLQEKYFANLIKAPVLIKIEPLQNEIKFETNVFNKIMRQAQLKNNPFAAHQGELDEKRDSIFLYNPWEKSDSICYYWTVNSIQNVVVHIYNPLNTELQINKLVIFFEGSKPFGFPVSTIIPARTYQSITCKLKPLEIGLTDIIGIRYEISSIGGVQYVDNNGNGLFYNLDHFGFNKQQKIIMKSIPIYPEIPLIKVI